MHNNLNYSIINFINIGISFKFIHCPENRIPRGNGQLFKKLILNNINLFEFEGN